VARFEQPSVAAPEPDGPAQQRAGLAKAGWVTVPVMVLLALGLSGLLRGGGREAVVASPAPPTLAPPITGWTVLPARLGYLTSGITGGSGPQLYLAGGSGDGAIAASGARSAVAFAWSPDGSHAGAVDVGGVLHLIPEGAAFGPAVRDFAFSRDGTTLAVCSGTGEQLTLLSVGPHLRRFGYPVDGCGPRWSPDDNYLAYRLPGGGWDAGGMEAFGFGVLNTHVTVHFVVPGRWPVDWAPAPGYAITPLTAVSAKGDSIEIMDPRGGQRRTLVSAAAIRHAAAGPESPRLRPAFREHGPITLLSWSPDGRWLAVGLGATRRDTGTAFLIDPLTGQLVLGGVPLAPSGVEPISFTWSSGDILLVGCRAPGGFRLTLEVVPVGSGVATRIDAWDATWSPDGRWILGQAVEGWVAVDAADLHHQVVLSPPGSSWTTARWCCPPADVVRSAEG
jgi:hypothetical protein